jgi:undecaprenyl diphosphate synthase
MLVQTAAPSMASINHVPEHVAIIPDGNRRWAAQMQRNLLEAYTIGAHALDICIDYAVERGVRNVTIWPTSTRTWLRSDSDVRALIAAVQFQLDMAQHSYPERGFRYRTIGRLDRFKTVAPEMVGRLIALEQATAALTTANITMAFDYDGQDEIARALRKIIEKKIPSEDVSPEVIGDHLDTAGLPDPDLIIRTGGDLRLSGFLPFQARYAEIQFLDVLLPDINPDIMSAAFNKFAARRYSQ